MNKNVFYIKNDKYINYISKNDVAFLSKYNKSRICTHKNKSSLLHEMFIFHKKGTLIPAHKHNVVESFLLIKGKMKLFIYDAKGNKNHSKVINSIFSHNNNLNFYYRVDKNTFHAQYFLKDTFFKESTLGPFKKNKTIYANW